MKPKDEMRKEAVVAAIADIIAQGGVSQVTARDVARRAGIAVGGIYLAFGTLDHAIVAANAHTLDRLDQKMQAAMVAAADAPLLEVFQVLARCYVDFAIHNRNDWAALSEFVPRDKSVLETHHAVLQSLVGRIVATLLRLRPDWSRSQAEVRARTLFSAVHGVVHMALEGWFLAAPQDRLHEEIDGLIAAMVEGMAQP